MALNEVLLWKPSNVESSKTALFIKFINRSRKTSISNYKDLLEYSTKHTNNFWIDVWKFTEVVGELKSLAIDEKEQMDTIPQWFKGSLINYAENMLATNENTSFTKIGLISTAEDGTIQQITRSQLLERVGQTARALHSVGVGSGDRVVAFVPNCIDAVIIS